MPVSPTYPGVYIEEIPSGVRTIAGVATSITAFLGRAIRGPIDEPISIFNFGDFERYFGGLDVDHPMSYAIRDFFGNGGGQAIVVRLYKEETEGVDGCARITYETLNLVASNPGTWGDNLTLSVNWDGINNDVGDRYDIDPVKLFNLVITDLTTGTTETISNVTYLDSTRRVDRVLKQSSILVLMDGVIPTVTDRPSETKDVHGKVIQLSFTGGVDSDALGPDEYKGSQNDKTGMYALAKTDLFNLLCIPPDTRDGYIDKDIYSDALAYCRDRRAMLIVDPPSMWSDSSMVNLDDIGLTGEDARNAAVFFPRVKVSDPCRENQIEIFVPCGIVAGIMARTDTQRGVWKAPAGIDAAINGIQGLSVNLTDDENGKLNPLGVNCFRSFPVYGKVLWGSRTLRGADQLADEYKYIPVRRLALYIEESLYRGTKWVVFEPNDEPLWAQIRLNVGAFMNSLFRKGAFQGTTAKDAYMVKCDKETTTQNDINLGIVNILVGFAPLKPAEFVIIKIQQLAGQIQS